jgi:hypothetical protein
MAKTTGWLKQQIIGFNFQTLKKPRNLESCKANLKQPGEEKSTCNSISMSSLEKDSTRLKFNNTVKEKNEMSTLRSTIERIRGLEEEKKSLLLEIEELKQLSEAKAAALESEVNDLRDEIKSLKLLMTEFEPKADRKLKK